MNLQWAYSHDEQKWLSEWCASLIPHVHCEGGFGGPMQVAAIVNDDGLLKGCVIFHDYQPSAGTLQISIATTTPCWASPQVIRDILAYAFVTNPTRKLWMAIPSDRQAVVDFNLHVGFRHDGTLRQQYSETQDAVILSMLDSEYRKGRWCGENVDPAKYHVSFVINPELTLG